MSMAIKYRMMKKMARGGVCMAHGEEVCPMCHGGKMAEGGDIEEDMLQDTPPGATKKVADSFRKAFHVPGYSKGGAVREDDRMLNQHGEYEVGAEGMGEDNEAPEEHMYEHPVENQDDHEDMVGRIMRHRARHYSKGGRVANDTPVSADFKDNDFDELALDDGLEEHYTDENSGDELGDDQENEDRKDIVARIMSSRKKKDRMPRPA